MLAMTNGVPDLPHTMLRRLQTDLTYDGLLAGRLLDLDMQRAHPLVGRVAPEVGVAVALYTLQQEYLERREVWPGEDTVLSLKLSSMSAVEEIRGKTRHCRNTSQ